MTHESHHVSTEHKLCFGQVAFCHSIHIPFYLFTVVFQGKTFISFGGEVFTEHYS